MFWNCKERMLGPNRSIINKSTQRGNKLKLAHCPSKHAIAGNQTLLRLECAESDSTLLNDGSVCFKNGKAAFKAQSQKLQLDKISVDP